MARFRSLREFDLDHLYVIQYGSFGKLLIREISVIVTAAEIARTDIPYDIAAFEVVRRKSSFSRIMVKSALLGSGIQCLYGVLAQGTKTHGADIVKAGIIRLFALRRPDAYSRVAVDLRKRNGLDAMVDPLVAYFINV
ncbi:hypothetical protein D3C86_1381520 [compost metagenome]